MIIQILSVTVETKPTAKGSYQMAEIAFKNLSYQGKVESKKVMSFGAGAPVFSVLKAAEGGSKWDITVVKNTTTGYNDWTAAAPSDGAVVGGATSAPVAQAYNKPGAALSAGTTRSTYETPEERAQKQVYIIRQSSLTAAINTLNVGSKSALKPTDVIEVAKEYESFVFGRGSVVEGLPSMGLSTGSGFDDMSDDVPL